jgi:predicted nucleotidyltransferase
MEIAERLNTLRRSRTHYRHRITLLTKQMDEYEESECPGNVDLIHYEKRFNDILTKFEAIQLELKQLDEEEHTIGLEITEQCDKLAMRISRHLKRLRQESISKQITGEAGIGCEPTPIKLPEIQLSSFDGTLENWHSFFDSFTSTIDRNERLTPVRKFQYLRSSLTENAARSIQSLDTTAINYPVAIDVLKDKFDCHRQVCMRHWNLIFDYLKITKETPEAIDDFLETVKGNLKALEKLGEPITSNVVHI